MSDTMSIAHQSYRTECLYNYLEHSQDASRWCPFIIHTTPCEQSCTLVFQGSSVLCPERFKT